MKLSELVSYQHEWELDRGIENGNHNLDRVQIELDEAKEAVDINDRLIEMVDVCIILAGGMAQLCQELGKPFEFVDEILESKLVTNLTKYSLERWFTPNRTPEEAQRIARYYWELGINPEEFESNDYT